MLTIDMARTLIEFSRYSIFLKIHVIAIVFFLYSCEHVLIIVSHLDAYLVDIGNAVEHSLNL